MRDIEPCLYGSDRCRNAYEYLGLLAESDIVLAEGDLASFAATALPLDDNLQLLEAWNALASRFNPVKNLSLAEGRPLRIYIKPPLRRISVESLLDESRGLVEVYDDMYAPGTVARTGAYTDFAIPLSKEAEPSLLVLKYAVPRPTSEPARFSVSIDGAAVAEISEEPPHPWRLLGLPVPEWRGHDGMLDVRIESDTYADNGKDYGITMDWVSVICRQASECIKE